MPRYIESLRVENGRLHQVEWHDRRMNETRRRFFGPCSDVLLQERVRLPADLGDGRYKCRVVYGQDIEEVTFQPYVPRLICTVRLVDAGSADYPYKSEDRDWLNRLFEMRGEADDVWMVKNGFLTDLSFANVALWDGSAWFTPESYLLNGTCRQRLLSEGRLTAISIRPEDLSRFVGFRPINALLDLDDSPFFRCLP